jgi:hypothetical protein
MAGDSFRNNTREYKKEVSWFGGSQCGKQNKTKQNKTNKQTTFLHR